MIISTTDLLPIYLFLVKYEFIFNVKKLMISLKNEIK